MTAEAATSAEKPATAQQRPRSRKGALPEWEEERWRNANSRKILLARLTCRYRPLLWTIWWMLTGALGVLNDPWSRSWLGNRFHLSQRLLNTIDSTVDLLWLALFVLIVLLAGWFGVWFRYLAWRAAQACGAVVRLVREGRRGFLLLLAAFFLAWIAYQTAISAGLWDGKPETSFDLSLVAAALAILTLSALSLSGFRLRRRIVVQPFKNLTGFSDLSNDLSERLCGDLAAIAHLYREIDEMTGQRNGRIYAPAIDVRDVGTLLESAVSADVSIDAKIVKIPLQLLMALSRRIFYKGWITGSLHQQNGCLVLLASFSGSGMARNWKVEPQDLDAEDHGQPLLVVLDKMLKQLAFRIATDLLATGSPKWRAVRLFTEGLRAYRKAQRTDIQKLPLLRQAERSLIKALGEDQQFALCHYNVGIIYREMNETPAAEAAFRRALKNNSEPAAACYALAEGFFRDKRYFDALWFAKNGIRRRPNDMMAWHLMAVCLYEQRRTSAKEGAVEGSKAWKEILETERIAVAMAWWDLCAWLAGGPARASASVTSSRNRRQETATITLSLANATALSYLSSKNSLKHRHKVRAQRIFEQAARLSPDDSVLYNEWGWELFHEKKAEMDSEDLLAAAQAHDRVFAGGLHSFPDQVDFWGRVLAVHAGLARSNRQDDDHPNIAREAYAYILDSAGLPESKSLEDLTESLDSILTDLEKIKMPFKAILFDLFDDAIESITRRRSEITKDYETRLRQLASGLQLENEDAAAFYHWRLRGIIDYLTELYKLKDPEALLRHGSERGAYFTERLANLDSFRKVHDSEEPPFLLTLSALLHARQEDWHWAYAQALTSFGKRPTGQESQRYTNVRKLLSKSIELFEAKCGGHRQQIVEQGLYHRLADACLRDADLQKQGSAESRTGLLLEGLKYAEISVALRPNGDKEHCVLGQIFQELGDHERAQQEWDIASFLDPGPQVLSMIGESFWHRAMERTSSGSRKEALEQAIDFFENAQKLCESNPQGEQERLGEVHSWLGSFYRETLQYDEAIFHHKVAGSMGFRPLEARTSLAWTYLEAGLFADAERVFHQVHREALAALNKEKDPLAGRSAGPGEAMPLHEVITRVYLGWALLYTDRGIRLSRAEELVRSAYGYIRWVRFYKRKELLARCRECLGWIYLQRQQLEGGTEADLIRASRHLSKAVHLFARAEAYWLLAQVHLSRSTLPSCEQTQELAKARAAGERARTSERRGRRLSDIESLLARIAEAEKPEPGPVSQPPTAHPSRLSFSPVAARRY